MKHRSFVSGGECPILCLGGGTPHKLAVLSENGHVIHEGSAYADYLLKKVSLASLLS